MTNKNDKIEITVAEFDELKDSEMKLLALESAGVDNWSGYDFAMELLSEMVEENELLQKESHAQTKERKG